ncbi:TPA: restriction endonuclease subunit S, partial [Aeromonas veronii]
PPNDELKAINQFLDYETARIDRLITQQLRLIELLKEKRQAVISHAVTKGLNPNAPMIDSGVEWLGQVPAHWVVRRLKHTAEIHSGIPKGKDLSGKDTITVPMLRVANVQDGYLNLDNVHEIEIEPHELVRYSLRAGDVLMNEGGDNDKLGRGAVWPGQIIPCIHQNHVFAIRVNNIEPEWLSWLTSSSYAKYYFYSVSKQSTNLASISSSNVKETPLVLPPKNERVEIMRYLDEKIAKLSGIESQAALQIELLQERRTALISAAVTGKIDLRGWTQPAEEAAV